MLTKPGMLGWMGADLGGATVTTAAPEFRASTNQVCGLWLFAAGSAAPMIGAPLGLHQVTGAPVSGDPLSWFRAGLIRNPSAFFLGEPGLGKTQLVMRMLTAAHGFGAIPIIPGDVRPDYVGLVRSLGGQVIPIGDGIHSLNILDPGELPEAVALMTRAARTAADAGDLARAHTLTDATLRLQADFHQRRTSIVSTILELSRGSRLTTAERNILDASLHHLDRTVDRVPVLADLLQVVQQAPEQLRAVAVDRGKESRYRRKTERLEEDLIGLISGGGIGTHFAAPTTEPMVRDRPVVYDISPIGDNNKPLLAAAMLACWSAGFATVKIATVLADHGLEPRRHYLIVLDELHRALQAGSGVIDHLDLLTRLNRSQNVGQIMVTHTMQDLEAVPDKKDRERAREFVTRAGMKILGGLPPAEMDRLRKVTRISDREAALIGEWSSPAAFDEHSPEKSVPPGRGKFLIKVGQKPGIPIDVIITPTEEGFNRSNSGWAVASRLGERIPEVADGDW